TLTHSPCLRHATGVVYLDNAFVLIEGHRHRFHKAGNGSVIDEELFSKFVDRDDPALQWIVLGLGLFGATWGKSEHEGQEDKNRVTKGMARSHALQFRC